MKKILILATAMVLLAILAVPMAAFADGTTNIDADIVATTVTVTPPGGFDFNTLYEGWNGPPSGDGQGDVEFIQGTATFNWQLKVYSKDDSTNDFSAGEMYGPGGYLSDPLYISFDNSAYPAANAGLTYNGGTSASYLYWIYAKQYISHADALLAPGTYFIIIYSEVSLVP